MMNGMDGYEACRRLKSSEVTRAIPVIFLTALTETFDKVRGFDVGAVDYVSKPFEPQELLARIGTHIALRREIEAHRRSKATLACLADEIRSVRSMIGDSPALRRVLEQIDQVAPTDSTVLIQGETGTGKELIARAIHDRSQRARARRSSGQLRGAAPGAGRERALRPREGRLHRRDASSAAAGSSWPTAARCSSTRSASCRWSCRRSCCACCRSGSSSASAARRPLQVDVRVIAATNRDLAAARGRGRVPRGPLLPAERRSRSRVPPLRERREDIPRLVEHFLGAAARQHGPAVRPSFAGDALERARALRLARQRARARERDRAGGGAGAEAHDWGDRSPVAAASDPEAGDGDGTATPMRWIGE